MEERVMRRKTPWRKSSGTSASDDLQALTAAGPAFGAMSAMSQNCDWNSHRM